MSLGILLIILSSMLSANIFLNLNSIESRGVSEAAYELIGYGYIHPFTTTTVSF